MIGQIKKRDGNIFEFDKIKITNAIYRAAREGGNEQRSECDLIADKVVEKINEEMPRGSIPTVEGVQDLVEQVLIETGHAKTAKSYIIYRQKRAELRAEKRLVLEKEEIDEVDKKFDLNALRVLKARYLRKDDNGKLIETPKQLFTRIAVHTGLPEIFYDETIFDEDAKQNSHESEEFEPAMYEDEISIGKYVLNKYHLEAVKRMYDRFDRQQQMKVSWAALLEMLKDGAFNEHEKTIDEFYGIMVNRQFMPNTPAIANFGSVLGMGSACFHPDQLVLTKDGPEKISEIKIGDEVLTHKGRFRKVKEVFMREANSLLSFGCKKLPKPSMLLTDEHPVLAVKNGEVNWYPAYTVRSGDHVALSYPTETEDVEKIKVSDVVQNVAVNGEQCSYEYSGGKFNAFVHTTKTVKNEIEVDYDLMKVFGFYLSEGNVSESDCVRFTLATDEMDYCQEIVSIMEKKFSITARIETNKDPERKWLSLRFHSTILAKFFENLFGTGFNKKKVPAWIMSLPIEKQKGLMSGMIRGDGTIFKNWKKMNARLVMSNNNLVYSFWQMCMRCGVFAALGKESMSKLATTQPVRCTLGNAKGQVLMNELFGRTIQEVVTEDKTLVINGIVFTEIENIEKVDYNGPVFNLEVEEDHSYVANMVSVHNCFVLGVEDDITSIMDTLKHTALIHQAGGGTGFNFSKLRPEGDIVKSTCGAASGPISFMTLYDNMTDVIKQGGMRRGANMGILNSNHPDIEKFITAKEGNKALRNFNISVLIMGDFWDYYEKDEPYPLINPRNGETVRTVSPKMLFDKIVYQAWESAEPGVIFFDKVNEFNPFLDHLGPIVTTNPCVAADTLVSTGRGLERIDSMKTDKIIVDSRTTSQTSNLLYAQIGCKSAELTNRMKTGHKDCYKIETNSGYEVIATPDHRILTTNGWKEVQNITENDSILIQSGEGSFNKDGDLPFEVKNEILGANGRLYKFNLPTKWSRELGLLLGWMTGDGWINHDRNQVGLVFAKEDVEAKRIIQPIFEKYCNRQITEIKYPNGCVQLRSASKHVVEFFKSLGVKQQREVPSSLFTATEDAILGFLEGLFSSDGTIAMGTKSRNYIRLNSSSLKLLKDVQKILLNLGIRTSIYDRSTKSKIFRYVKKSGEIIKYKTSGENYELNISKINVLKFIQKMNFVQNKNKQKIEALQKFEFYKERFADKVKSKDFVGKKEVWDITEPETHSFIANGIVVHNCGEVLLYPNEPCNLGSINVWAFAKEDENGQVYVDWEDMTRVIKIVTRFMDNIIDVNKWPLRQIEDMALSTRKIGVGIMGVGDLLFEMGLPYDKDEGREFMEELMEFVNYWTKVESVELAKERGPLPFFDKSFYPQGRLPFSGSAKHDKWHFDWDEISERVKMHGIRNSYTTIIAPTGSISMIAGCSSGIEPVYSLVFEKNVKVGSFFYIDPVFEKVMKREGLYDEELMKEIAENNGSIQNIPYIPQKLKDAFVTAMDVNPESHIRALAAFQRWVDSSISKTNNFPANATIEDMRKSYIFAYQLGCKGVTVFRDSSIKDQVLVAPKREKTIEIKKEKYVMKPATQEVPTSTGLVLKQQNGHKQLEARGAELNTLAGQRSAATLALASKHDYKECPECSSVALALKEGCITCESCGWGLCS